MRLAADWWQSKTTRLMLAVLLGTLATYLSGAIGWKEAVVAVLLALAKFVERDTMARTQEDLRTEIAVGSYETQQAHAAAVGVLRAELAAALQTATATADKVLQTSVTVLDQAAALRESR